MADAWTAVFDALDGGPPADPGGAVLIVSAHPDDEVLAVGGWIAEQGGRDLRFVTATDGEASHPGSEILTRAELTARRPLELLDALQRLGVGQPNVQRLKLPDGGLGEHRSTLRAALEPSVRRADLVLAPFEADGHPDHDVVGQVCRELCEEVDVNTVLWRYPIWTWEWAVPQDQSWLPNLARLEVGETARRRKRHAIAAFRTQVESADGDSTAAIVTPGLMDHATTAAEVVVA